MSAVFSTTPVGWVVKTVRKDGLSDALRQLMPAGLALVGVKRGRFSDNSARGSLLGLLDADLEWLRENKKCKRTIADGRPSSVPRSTR